MDPKRSYPRVLVAVATGNGGRDIVSGVLEYADTAGWGHVAVTPFGKVFRGIGPEGRFDGAIFMVWNPLIASVAERLNCPIVNVAAKSDVAPYTTVQTDDDAIGKLAVQHLWERGLRRFGAVEVDDVGTHGDRVESYLQELRVRGIPTSDVVLLKQAQAWDFDATIPLLKKLPKPIGFFGFTDNAALGLVRACGIGGVRVPNEVAVLGCDNVDSLVEQASPLLSSIQLPMLQLGRMAGETLDRLLHGATDVPEQSLVSPLRVITRGSSQIDVVADSQITHALQIMRTPEGLRRNIGELADSLLMTRRTLERRFRRFVGCSPADELRRLRLERAMVLLAKSKMPIYQIAADLGFATATHFSTFFVENTNSSPTKYRALHQD